MRLYLSSYKLGERIDELKKLLKVTGYRAAYIPNALDFSEDMERRKKSEADDVVDLEELGLKVERLDLRGYFNETSNLRKKLSEFGVIWVRGGNVFVLRQAMRLSGFDVIIHEIKNRDDLLYGGYSSGICVLAQTLDGLNLVDDQNVYPYRENNKKISEGLSLIDYSIVPHYNSNHRESNNIELVINYMIKNKILFKALHDGEVIIT